MPFFTEMSLHYNRKVKEVLRNPIVLSFMCFLPLMYLFLYAPLLKNFTSLPGFQGGNILNTFLPGVLVTLGVFGGAFSGFRLCEELREGIIERFRVTPSSRLAILFGAVAKDVSMVLIQALIFTGAAWFFGFHPDPLGFLLTLVVLTLNTVIFASYSYAMALKFQSEDAMAPLVQVATLPILLLAGFLLPMDLAPKWLRMASHFDPVYYSIQASRDLMNGHLNRPGLWQVFAVNVPLAGLILWMAARLVRNTIR